MLYHRSRMLDIGQGNNERACLPSGSLDDVPILDPVGIHLAVVDAALEITV